MQSPLTLHCPACGTRIRARLGCHAEILLEAVRLQSARYGTELCCQECHVHHVVQRIDPSRDALLGEPSPGSSADVADGRSPTDHGRAE